MKHNWGNVVNAKAAAAAASFLRRELSPAVKYCGGAAGCEVLSKRPLSSLLLVVVACSQGSFSALSGSTASSPGHGLGGSIRPGQLLVSWRGPGTVLSGARALYHFETQCQSELQGSMISTENRNV